MINLLAITAVVLNFSTMSIDVYTKDTKVAHCKVLQAEKAPDGSTTTAWIKCEAP